MDIFDALTLVGGLSLFLFGMSLMGQALERRAGSGLRTLLGRLTTGKLAGLLTGLCVTAVIQSSSAATVMVVGFVNSGLMTLKQAINVIMGANIGTTVTAWLLSLAGIESGNLFVRLLKPTSFTPVLACIGIVCYLFSKGGKRRDTGIILLGFSTLMFGMEEMSSAVAGLGQVPAFQELFLLFRSPLLGLLAGAILTAVIQSSSASVGILQALAVTGQVSYAAAIPIIMGQNIGTCVTAMLSSVGTNKNARRAALVHLSFNVIGSVVWLAVFWGVKSLLYPAWLDSPASLFGIAVAHSAFNVLCTLLMLPMSGLLERLVIALVPDTPQREVQVDLDERLFAAPSLALERCQAVASDMAQISVAALKESLTTLECYSLDVASSVREKEECSDRYEDALGTYLVKLSGQRLSGEDQAQAAKLLKMIGDFERISDHAVNLVRAAEELREKQLSFTTPAREELARLTGAVNELLGLTLTAFLQDDLDSAAAVEPLTQVIGQLKEQLRTSHILRMQRGECCIEVGFVWSDLLTDLDRTAGHCSNIAGCVIDIARNNINLHASLRKLRHDNEDYRRQFASFASKYALS